MIPILYRADEKDFTTQGLGLLSDVQSAKVTEQRNAQYYLNMEIPVFSRLFKEIKLERLVKADDHNGENQLFRIKKIDTPSNGLCNIYAEHISRDIEGYTINPEIQFMGPANQALEIWKKNLVEKDKVTVFSDITFNSPSKYWMIDEMENPFYYLGGKQGSILQVYNGEYKFDNLNIKLLKTRGANTGASITYGRNMNDLTQEESIEELANSIYPFAWKDKEDGNQEDREMIVLDPLYVDGPHIDKYAERRVVFVDFTDKTPKDKGALKKLAEKYVKDNNVGAPKVSMTVSPVLDGQIAKGLELEKFERVNLCDIVTVKYYKLGIDVQAKVNEVTFDVLSQRFYEYKLGDEKRTLASSLGAIENSVSNVGKELDDLKGFAQQSADGKNTIFYGKDEPKADKVGDTWFKENADGSTTIHVWDGQTWKEVKTDYTEEFQKLDEELEEHKLEIDESLKKAEQAIEDAGFSKEQSEKAIENSEKAIEEAGFVGESLTTINGELQSQSNKIDQIEKTTIENGKTIELVGTNLKETISKTDGNTKNITQLESDFNGLSSTVIELEKDFENLELPARNIVRDSLVESCNSSYPFKKFELVEKWDITQEYQFVLKGVIPDGKTPKFYGKDVSKSGMASLSKIGDNLYGYYGKIEFLTDDSPVLNVFLYPNDGVESCVDWVAIYKNDKTTQWYPALEDNSKTLAKHWTAIEQNAKDIKLQSGEIKDGKEKLSKLELTSEGIKSSVTELENRSTGGRNVLYDTQNLSKNIGTHKIINETYNGNKVAMSVLNPGATYADLFNQPSIYPLTESEYVVTFWAKSKVDKTVMECYFYSPNTTIHGETSQGTVNVTTDGRIPITLSTKWEKYWVKWKQRDTTTIKRIIIGRVMANAYSDIYMSSPMLSAGNVPLEWSPAPEDNEYKISSIEQNVNGIQTVVKNKADKSEVTQLANQITSVVKGIGSDNLLYNTSDFENIDGWKKGGGDGYISIATHPFYKGGKSKIIRIDAYTKNEVYLTSNLIRVKKNQTYTISWLGFSDTNTINSDIWVMGRKKEQPNVDISKLIHRFKQSPSSPQYFEVQFKNTEFDEMSIRFDNNGRIDENKGSAMFITEMMMVEGEYSTSYSKGGIDYESGIIQNKNQILETIKSTDGRFIEVNKTINGIQTTVEDKADISQVTQLSGQITSVVKNNSVPNLIINSSMINRDYSGWTIGDGWYSSVVSIGGNGVLAVNKDGTSPLSRAINDFLEIRANSVLSFSVEGFTESRSGGGWYSAIAFYDDSKNYISEVRVPLDNKNLKEWEVFYRDGIIVPENSKYTRVAIIAVGGIWAYFGKPMLVQSDTIVPYRPSEVSQSQLTQTKDMINLKVSKGDVMSQINVEADKMLFQSKKMVFDAETVLIKGQAWMDGAIIKDASIGTAQIENASITNAKIGSMDVGKLTSGTIKTGNIKIASTLEITDANGTLNGHYDYREDSAIEKRRFNGSWKLGWRDLQFSGMTYDLTSNYKARTETSFGQDTIKMRSMKSDGESIKQRIDMRVYSKAEIELVEYEKSSDKWAHSTRITPQYVRADNIGAKVIHNNTVSDEQKLDLSKWLHIYPSDPNDPTSSAVGFSIRRNTPDGEAIWGVKSDYIANSRGGGAYEVRMSSANYLRSSKYADNTLTLKASKPLSLARSRSAVSMIPNVNGIDMLTPSVWKDGNRPKESTSYRPMMRSASQYNPINKEYVTGYTVEDLVDAGLTNAVIYDSETGEPNGINLNGLMPYVFENIKLLKKDNKILKRQISDLREDVESQSKTDSYMDRYQEYDNKYSPATAYGNMSLSQNESATYKNDESVYQQVAQPLTFKYNLVS